MMLSRCCSCCSAIIKCSFTSTLCQHSWKHEDKLKHTTRFISKTYSVFCIGLHLFHGIKVVSQSTESERSVSLGWLWASNVLPLDELWRELYSLAEPLLYLWLKSRGVDRIDRRRRGGGGQRFPITCKILASLSRNFTINLCEKQPL